MLALLAYKGREPFLITAMLCPKTGVETVSKLEEYQQYLHNLLMDEIHISQKLVYSRATGEMILAISILVLEPGTDEPTLAKTILTYMANSVKAVVAAYPTVKLSREDIYEYSWEVISNCEIAGIKILSVVCDGSSLNRSFFQMHRPVTELPSGLVFDTINLCAPDRTLYFISDTPHLLKTIRNCFAKSGVHSKCKRRLTKGSQVIVWKTIERVFLEDHANTWRRNCKLNSMIVYLNSYSCMKVSYAAQVMSNTTSLDLRERKWPGTSETVEFFSRVNNFFDCLNGAHSEQGHRTANECLNPYTDVNDKRFTELEEFLGYLKE
ncbi:hypothetical protein FOCC_FOCC014581 [Frankliniella occidentalis]|nr:hypothetical protein FOCC_FOCC014581 [Frankliniella occidentalis]